jgi:phosphoribosylanthranilate isomerase
MTARTRVCVYGARTLDDGLAAAEGGADAVGFYFSPPGPLAVRPEAAWEIAQRLPPFVSTIGVFTNTTVERFCAIEEACPTEYSQLHGEEPEEVVRQCGPRVVKTVRPTIDDLAADIGRWRLVDEVDAVLVIAGRDGRVTWEAVRAAAPRAGRPLIIGGGLTVHNVGDAVRTVRPWGVAVRDHVFTDEGRIGRHLVEHFCSAVRKADRS